MRLLNWGDDGALSFTANLGSEDTIPPYAILSHTWGQDEEEVTFDELLQGSGNNKPGYEKIRFCRDQAQQDGLRYFWIDTCCIDKENKVELSQAIQSMFRWYRDAARCYVYLPDVSTALIESNGANPPLWESDLRRSRWFTRGWTLQELLAPSEVEFFSREGKKLGSKTTLAPKLHEITGIPVSALLGSPLSQFSVDDRLSWREHRYTKVPEDGAYSLLGIFDIYIAPLYGEGAKGAFRRLLEKIQQTQDLIRDIRNTDPRDDKKRIQGTKGGLLEDSYRWIFDNDNFRQWQDDLNESRLLWIKGDPGKGKTMLLCGIIDELQKARKTLVSYFFCQATDLRINSATAVLRGLLYLLISQLPSLVSCIRKKYDQGGRAVFEDANAWVVLTDMFTDVLKDPNLQSTTYLVIDALDECVTDLPKLLEFVEAHASTASRVKWIVSSRNWPEIEQKLGTTNYRLSLELNADSVSAAVQAFIEQRVSRLSQQRKYDEQIQDAVLKHLTANANDTFLWVALVCQNLESTAKRHVLKKLSVFPPGLDSLYKRMMEYIDHSDDAELCRYILATAAVVYRPLLLEELVVLVEGFEDVTDIESIQEIISLCGSFLTLRNGSVYFVHQSAQEFLLTQAVGKIFPCGLDDIHSTIFTKSLNIMTITLHRDMYQLKELGISIEDVKQPDPDPLVASRYSCVHWIDHLNESFAQTRISALSETGSVNKFLKRHYLYWLEAMSLCSSMPQGVVSMAKLQSIVQRIESTVSFAELVHDAYRFIMYHKTVIESNPLQVYGSALLFSPTRSRTRGMYRHEHPDWITIMPATSETWSSCLQTFECSSYPCSLVFSLNSTRLAIGLEDGTVRVWDVDSGSCLQTFQCEAYGYEEGEYSFGFGSTWLTSGYDGRSMKIWDAKTGILKQVFGKDTGVFAMSIFSHDSTKLASACRRGTIRIWDIETGSCLQTLTGHIRVLTTLEFSHDSALVASTSNDGTAKVWDANSGECLHTFYERSFVPRKIGFSPDSTILATGSFGGLIKIWDIQTGVCVQTLEGHNDHITTLAFSHDSTKLASGSRNCVVIIWDVSSGACILTLQEHTSLILSVIFSHDSTKLASGSDDRTIKIWDINTKVSEHLETESHDQSVKSVAICAKSFRLASAAEDGTVKIWDVTNGACLWTLQGSAGTNLGPETQPVAISHDSTRLALLSDHGVQIWDLKSGMCLHTLEIGQQNKIYSMAFSHNSNQLVTAGNVTMIWDIRSGAFLRTLKTRSRRIRSSAFSPDSTWMALSHVGSVVQILDISSGTMLVEFTTQLDTKSLEFSDDSTRIACTLPFSRVQIWDTRSGTRLQEFVMDTLPHHYSFGLITPTVPTKLVLDSMTGSQIQQYQYMGVGVSLDQAWITYKGKRVIAIPPSHRGISLCVNERTAGLGCWSGKVLMATINPASRSIENI